MTYAVITMVLVIFSCSPCIGLPTNTDKRQEEDLHKERDMRLERIKKKKDNLSELQTQQVAYRNLLTRNARVDCISWINVCDRV